jgi:hypothetical protein
MKKSILALSFTLMSVAGMAQTLKDTVKSKQDTVGLIISKEMVIKLYNIIPIVAKAIPSSMDIKAAEATYALPILQELYAQIVNKYQSKTPAKKSQTESK